jgi:hypothetical protein
MYRIKSALLIAVTAALSFMSLTLTVVLLAAFYWLLAGRPPGFILSIISVMAGLTALIAEHIGLVVVAVFLIGVMSSFEYLKRASFAAEKSR